MARYKPYDQSQSKFIPVVFSQQILPGSFEYTVNFLVDEHLDLSRFDSRYCNDNTGRPAYDPALLLKVILSAYARGITSSRKIEKLCQENIVFMALSADSQPHFTTIANFISKMDTVIQQLFTEVLLVCDQQGLIGREMFAIDGCKMPSNASKEWSGKLEDLQNKQQKIDRAVRRMMKRHREEDQAGEDIEQQRRDRELKNIETLRKASQKIKAFCKQADDKQGSRGKIIQSNITDNQSAKMKTSKGVIQGYNGVAAVDQQNQVIVAAEAFGQGPENDLLEPMIEQAKSCPVGLLKPGTKVTADSGFHSQNTVQYCEDQQLDAYIADGNFRKRDPRFTERDRYKPKERKSRWFKAEEFNYNPENDQCICPAGKQMWKSHQHKIGDSIYQAFVGYLKDCTTCPLRQKCMRKPVKEQGRQVSIKLKNALSGNISPVTRMKRKIDSKQGRHIYSQRLGAVEPVFGNINTTKGLSRFSLRGKTKVNAQWLMFCMVHNIEKIQRYGKSV